MTLSTIEKLCCPFDKNDLVLDIRVKDLDLNVIMGTLTCPDCKRVYPIIHGVPVMAPDEFRQPALEKSLPGWQQDPALPGLNNQ
jgi:uncharacterized protein YbaR (Trm112 family)